jgi:hypothetical protein
VYICWEKFWTDNSNNAGQRLKVVHAEGIMAFNPGGVLMYDSKTKTSDYQDKMYGYNINKWVKNQLISGLTVGSNVILGNASYHNKQIKYTHPTHCYMICSLGLEPTGTITGAVS